MITTRIADWNPQGKTGNTTRWRDPDNKDRVLGESQDHTRLSAGTRLGKMFAKTPSNESGGTLEKSPTVEVTHDIDPNVEGFACTHGCGKTSPTKAGIRAHERSHK